MGIDQVAEAREDAGAGQKGPVATAGQRFFIVGGAGFIGSHFTDHLLGDPAVAGVTLYDNFSSGREWHYAHHAEDRRLRVVRGDVEKLDALRAAMDGHDVVIHLASNPDIARAATEPDVDFWQGTALTHNVVEAMRTHQRQAHPLRVGQRRVRRPRRPSRPPRTTARSCRCRPTARASSRARR